MAKVPIWAGAKIGKEYYGVSYLQGPKFSITRTPSQDLKKASAGIIEKIEADYKLQPDIAFWSGILDTEGANLNNDLIKKPRIIATQQSIVGKPFDFDHDRKHIIGFTSHSNLIDDDGNELTEAEAEATEKTIHINNGGIIWRFNSPLEAEVVAGAAGGINTYGLSMECLFKDFSIISGSHNIEMDNPDFGRFYALWKSGGSFEDKPVLRDIKDHFYSGLAVVKERANPPSAIYSFKSDDVSCDSESGCVIAESGTSDDCSCDKCSKANVEKNKGVHVVTPADFGATEFDVAGDGAEILLTEIHDEATDQGLKEVEESDASVGKRPTKKKSGRRTPMRSASKNRKTYGDITNWKFPAHNLTHAMASLKTFFGSENSTKEYDAAEKLFILRRLAQKSQDVGLKISDAILSTVRLQVSDAEESEEGSGAKEEVTVVQGDKGQEDVDHVDQLDSNKTKEDNMPEIDEVKAELAQAKQALKDKDKDLETKAAEIKAASDKSEVSDKRATDAEATLEKQEKQISLTNRMGELDEAGLTFEGKARKSQEARVINMDDDAFAAYKDDLVLTAENAKASIEADKEKVEVEAKEKLEADAKEAKEKEEAEAKEHGKDDKKKDKKKDPDDKSAKASDKKEDEKEEIEAVPEVDVSDADAAAKIQQSAESAEDDKAKLLRF